MRRSRILPAAIASIALGGAAAAFAAGEKEFDEQKEITTVLNAKISLAQAIAVAEQQTGGKAFDTGLEKRDGNVAYEVTVAQGTTVQKVLVDMNTGAVLKVATSESRDEDDDDDEDEE
jgi:uncharacterized membrane protein YkoI